MANTHQPTVQAGVNPAPRRSPFRRISNLVLLGVLGLVLLGLLALLFEAWRGERAWRRHRLQAMAAGEPFDFKGLTPPPVPDDQNFAMTPLLAPLLDYTRDAKGKVQWRTTDAPARQNSEFLSLYLGKPQKGAPKLGDWHLGQRTDVAAWQRFYRGISNTVGIPNLPKPGAEILEVLSRYDAELNELRSALRRPFAQFPVHYEEGFNALLPHLATLRSVGRLLQFRAIAALDAGRSELALDDVRMAFRLGEALRNEPLLISGLVRMAMLQGALQPIWEGLADHRWTEPQLVALDENLARLDFVSDLLPAYRGERLTTVQAIEGMLQGKYSMSEMGGEFDTGSKPPPRFLRELGRGFFRQNQVAVSAFYQHTMNTLQGVTNRADRHASIDRTVLDTIEGAFPSRSPYTMYAHLLAASVNKAVEKARYAQCCVDLARVAVALERFHLGRGQYPSSLEALQPDYLSRVPFDMVTGDPLQYRRTPDGRFVLYSVGANEMDDGGEIPLNSRSGSVPDEGDWVWRYPKSK